MMRLWDYFMRRKKLLFLLLLALVGGGFLGSKVIQSITIQTNTEPEYISINTWANEDIEIPHTGPMMPTFAVVQPNELVMLFGIMPESELLAEDNSDESATPEDLDNLEELEMPGSAVVEVMPPHSEMSDEVLGQAIESVNQNSHNDTIANEDNASINKVRSWLEIAGVLAMSVIVISLGGYLTYWHFRR